MARILVIDDTIEIRSLLSLYLSREGYHVTTAENPKDLKIPLIPGYFDLAILDINMPLVTGIEFGQTLKDKLGSARPPIIFLTAESGRDQVEKALELKPISYLLKPIAKEKLLNLVKSTISLNEVDRLNIRLKDFQKAKVYCGPFPQWVSISSIHETGLMIVGEKPFKNEDTLEIESDFLKSIGLPRIIAKVNYQSHVDGCWTISLQFQNLTGVKLKSLRAWLKASSEPQYSIMSQ